MKRYLYLSLIEAVIVSSVFSSLFLFRHLNRTTFIFSMALSFSSLVLHFLFSLQRFKRTEIYHRRYLLVGKQGLLEGILIGLILFLLSFLFLFPGFASLKPIEIILICLFCLGFIPIVFIFLTFLSTSIEFLFKKICHPPSRGELIIAIALSGLFMLAWIIKGYEVLHNKSI
jgi:hypothetical protein